jgi:hypothetical protein
MVVNVDFSSKDLALFSVGLTIYMAFQFLTVPLDYFFMPLLFSTGAIITGFMKGLMPSRAYWAFYLTTRIEWLTSLPVKVISLQNIKFGFPGIEVPIPDNWVMWVAAYCIVTELAGPFVMYRVFKRLGIYSKVPGMFLD